MIAAGRDRVAPGGRLPPVAALVAVLVVPLVACGPKPSPAWVGDDRQRHESRSRAAAGPLEPPVDLAKLSPDTIDELDEATARIVVDRLADRAPAARVALRAARLAHHRGDDAQARADLARAATGGDAGELRDAIAALAAELVDVPVRPELVAVLLPLSGRFGSVGAELRTAIELAPAQGTRWLFVDTRGEPAGAEAAVEAAAKQGAVAILGPVGAREVTVAARAAALRGIPIALLGPEDGADASAGVFRARRLARRRGARGRRARQERELPDRRGVRAARRGRRRGGGGVRRRGPAARTPGDRAGHVRPDRRRRRA